MEMKLPAIQRSLRRLRRGRARRKLGGGGTRKRRGGSNLTDYLDERCQHILDKYIKPRTRPMDTGTREFVELLVHVRTVGVTRDGGLPSKAESKNMKVMNETHSKKSDEKKNTTANENEEKERQDMAKEDTWTREAQNKEKRANVDIAEPKVLYFSNFTDVTNDNLISGKELADVSSLRIPWTLSLNSETKLNVSSKVRQLVIHGRKPDPPETQRGGGITLPSSYPGLLPQSIEFIRFLTDTPNTTNDRLPSDTRGGGLKHLINTVMHTDTVEATRHDRFR